MNAPPVLPLDQPQFLFDDGWLADARRLTRRWLPATVQPAPVLQADRPWEGRALLLYGSLVPRPGGGWRLYYTNLVRGEAFGPPRVVPSTMIAESDNGMDWYKPLLPLFPDADGAPTNRVLCPAPHSDSPSVLDDPADEAARYKQILFATDGRVDGWSNPSWGMHTFGSRDGLRWERLRADGLASLAAGDRSNLLATRVDGDYWLYTRHQAMGTQTGGRAVYLSRSADFRAWTEPELVLRPDLEDAPDVEFYGMAVYRQHGWYLGLLEYWHSAVDLITVHLAVSRDGRQWQRPCRTPFIGGTQPWNYRWSTCASSGPLTVHDELLFFLGGRATAHNFGAATLDGAIGLATLPVDRYCALEGQHYGGQCTTPAFVWPGGELAVNADTRRLFDGHPFHCNGELAVEVLTADGAPLAEWSGPQRAVFRGNTHCRGRVEPGWVRWSGDRPLTALAGTSLRLRFHLNDARLFTFAARTAPTG